MTIENARAVITSVEVNCRASEFTSVKLEFLMPIFGVPELEAIRNLESFDFAKIFGAAEVRQALSVAIEKEVALHQRKIKFTD